MKAVGLIPSTEKKVIKRESKSEKEVTFEDSGFKHVCAFNKVELRQIIHYLYYISKIGNQYIFTLLCTLYRNYSTM